MLRVPPPVPRWQAVLWPFTQYTWFALAVGLLLSGPLLYCMGRCSAQSLGHSSYLESMMSSYLHAISMHLLEPVAREPNTNTSQVVVAFLWLYTMVLGMSYCSNLIAFLTVTRQPRTIDTFKDYQESDLSIVGLGPLFGDLMMGSTNDYIKELSKRYITVTSHPESWVTDGRAGYISNHKYLQFTVAKINSENRAPVVRITKECAWPFSLAVGLQSFSPLKPRIDEVINNIVQSGMLSYWFDESVRSASQRRRKPQRGTADGAEASDTGKVVALNTDHMQGAFYILALSYLFAILIFLAELIARRRKPHSRN